MSVAGERKGGWRSIRNCRDDGGRNRRDEGGETMRGRKGWRRRG